LHAIRAILARIESRPQDAINEYKLAIANLPAEGVAEGQLYPVQLHLNLAELYRGEDDDASARQQVAEAEQLINKIHVEGPAKAEFLRVRASIKSGENDFPGAAAYPDDYVPHLALGDLYTATREFSKADLQYQAGYKLAPRNPIIVANAANAAIEARKIDLAGAWLDRATGAMLDDGKVMLERERYLFHKGKYVESAQLGYKVLQKLPKDRNASVYLGYALYNRGRYADVLALATKYQGILPKEPNFPLL